MSLKQSIHKAIQALINFLPIIMGILMLISLFNMSLQDYYSKIFTKNLLIDPIIGALAGGIIFGFPITSYVAGGELLSGGVSLLSITAFIISWSSFLLACFVAS